MTQLNNDLIREAHRATSRHNRLKKQMMDAVIARYGSYPSGLDYDDIVGGYVGGRASSLQGCDLLMGSFGLFPKEEK